MENGKEVHEGTSSYQSDLLARNLLHHHLIFEYIQDDNLLNNSATDFCVENPYAICQHLEFHQRDAFQELLEKKQKYWQVINSYKKYFSRDRKLSHKKFSKSKYRSLPKYIIDVTTNKIKDPDIYFPNDCDYNWYFTGGLLDFVSSNGTDYLTTVNEENNVRFVNLNDTERGFICKTGFSKKHDIYYCKNFILPDSTILLALRSKNKIGILRTVLSEENECNTNEFLSKTYKKSTTPFLDLKINKSDLNSFCTLTVKKRVCLYDITQSEKVSFYEMPMGDETKCVSFAQVEFLKENLMALLNEQDIYIMDKRCSDIKTSKLELDTCDNFCSFLTGNDHFLYIATKHSFAKYDLRKFDIVYKYFHMLQSTPYLMSIVNTNNTDIICLANQQSKLLLIDEMSKHSVPYQVPSIMDTYRKMQIYEELHMREDIERRLNASTVGMQLVQTEKDQLNLFSVNAVGDLFTQKLYNSDISKSEQKLNSWIKTWPDVNTQLVLTGVVENSAARFALNRIVNRKALKTLEKVYTVPFKKSGALYEKKENHFGNHLEEIWLEDVDESISEDEVLIPELRTSDKVSAWLSSQFIDNDSHKPS